MNTMQTHVQRKASHKQRRRHDRHEGRYVFSCDWREGKGTGFGRTRNSTRIKTKLFLKATYTPCSSASGRVRAATRPPPRWGRTRAGGPRRQRTTTRSQRRRLRPPCWRRRPPAPPPPRLAPRPWLRRRRPRSWGWRTRAGERTPSRVLTRTPSLTQTPGRNFSEDPLHG